MQALLTFLFWKIPIRDKYFILIVFLNNNKYPAKDDIAEIFWIGLNQLDVSGGWQWSDHKPLNFVNWHPGNDVSGGINNI